jgi:hypothetical protein
MIPTWRRILGLTVLAILVAATSLPAQPTGQPSPVQSPLDVAAGAAAEDSISPQEMLNRSASVIAEMRGMLERVIAVQQVARKQKDVIRLNCVNDRLLQIKKLLNIAESSRNDLVEAVAADNPTERAHQFGKVTIAHEKVTVLRDEAEACVGEELIFLGPTEVTAEHPPIVDDPTRSDPFVLTGGGLERPAYASPFL